MPGLSATDMADLIISVNDNYPADGSFEDLFDSSVHAFELINRIFTREKTSIQGGEYISRFVNYRENGTAEFVQPAQVYQPSISATLKKLTIPWRHAHDHYSIVREELLACREPEQLVNLVVPRRQSTQMALALLIEKRFFGAPDSTSEVLPLSIPYFVVPITTTQVAAATTLAGAFQGANPVDLNAVAFSDCAAIDASDAIYARWRNWNAVSDNSTGDYTQTVEDRLGRMFRHLQFQVPATVEDLKKPAFDNKRVYINETTLQSMEKAAKGQNDQVGRDLAKFQGRTLWNSLPLIWIDALDTYSSTRGYFPVYLINYAHLYPVVRSGDFFRQQTFPADKYQPDVTTTHEDVSYNVLCDNRQGVGGVLSYVA